MAALPPAELDLPLTDGAAGRFLLWWTALMVALAALALALVAASTAEPGGVAREARLLAVILPAQEDAQAAEAEAERVAKGLGAEPGVAFARAVAPAELVRPRSLAEIEPAAGPLLPRIVDVAINPGFRFDPEALRRAVAGLAPEAKLVAKADETAATLVEAARLRRLALVTALAALLTLALAAALATRVALAVEREAIDLLRQLGATDGYLARQLEQHALALALRGGLIGLVAAIACLIAVLGPLRAQLPWSPPSPLEWLLLAILPAVAALLSRAAARLTARRYLRRVG